MMKTICIVPQDLGSSLGLWLGLGVIQAVETLGAWMTKRD
jgi:hypothetical protein